jgi:F-type H+-transporting ATPase subunit alpha
LSEERNGGSLTALPIIETQAQNISAYIPTNLISITDGQIYLSPDLFRRGQLPAIDIGKSVSRVGGKAQLPAFRSVAGDLRLSYAQFEELETFSRFGTRLDEETVRKLERGRRVREILKQDEHDLLPMPEQITVLLAATQGLLDAIGVERVRDAEKRLREAAQRLSDVWKRVEEGDKLDEDAREAILDLTRGVLREYRESEEQGDSEGGNA